MNKGTLSIIETKFLTLFDLIYQLIKTSFFFWITLIKNFIFLGLTVSFCTLLEVMEEVSSGNGLPIRRLFQDISPKYKSYKKLSLAMVCLIVYLSAFIILPFPLSISSNAILIIKFALLYLFLLILMLFTYISWILVKMELPLKQSILYGFYLMIKRFFRTIILISIMMVLFSLSHRNAIFFIFLAPSLYAFGVRLVLHKIVV